MIYHMVPFSVTFDPGCFKCMPLFDINVKKTSSLKQCVRAIRLVVIIHLKL